MKKLPLINFSNILCFGAFLLCFQILGAKADVIQIHLRIKNNNTCSKSILLYLGQLPCNFQSGTDFHLSQNWVIGPGQTLIYDYVSQDNYNNCGGIWRADLKEYPQTSDVVTLMPPTESTAEPFIATLGTEGVIGCSSDITSQQDESDSSPSSPCAEPGMPIWQVSEPYVSLWITDQPLGYQPAIGPRVSLDLAYKQRGVAEGVNSNIFGFGKRWTCPWISYLVKQKEDDDTSTNYFLRIPGRGGVGVVETVSRSSSSGGGSSVSSGGGTGRRSYCVALPNVHRPPQAQDVDYSSNTILVGDKTNGFNLYYPDGSRDFYGLVVTNSTGKMGNAFITERWNAEGQKIRFDYFSYTPSDNPVIRLKCVVDGDNKTNLIYYVASNAFSTNLISAIVDPYGRTNLLAYDNLGQLTNITDVAGLSSSFGYNGTLCITNMTTPYGTTSFEYSEVPASNSQPAWVSRSILVTEPDSSKQLFLYTNNAPGIASSYSTNEIPNVSPFSNTFDTTNLNLRTSFHWDRRQYAALSTSNIASFTANDFRIARMKHWLKTHTGMFSPTLSMERDPSPDISGEIEGQKTWYDYAGKSTTSYQASPNAEIGTQIRPLMIAQVLSDGTTRFTRTPRNVIGWETNAISTFSVGSTVYLRTNVIVYETNNIDVIAVTNALGVRTVGNLYNANHQVLINSNALNETTVNTYDLNSRLTSTTLPSGLVTTNVYGTDGYLEKQIVLGFATNSYTWANALILSHTDPRGLTTTNSWDALERLRCVTYPDGSFITNTYDKLDLIRVVDRMNFTNRFEFNSLRQLTISIDALNRTNIYDYCTCGALNSVRDAAGYYTFFYRDNLNRPTNTVYADGYSVTNSFNLLGQLLITRDNAGTSVTNWFNNQGLIVAVSNVLGRLQTVAYDNLDRATNSVDANGIGIDTSYDALNRIRSRSYPDGGAESFGYTLNVMGLTSYTNQLNQVTSYGYDAASRKVSETNANLEVTRFGMNGPGDLLTLTDGKNQTTTWEYDSFGRVTNKVDAAGSLVFVYQYDLNNRLTNRWSIAKGGTVYRYDPVGNLTNIVYPISPSISMAYDVLNRMTNMVDAIGTTEYNYDNVGQLLSEDGPWINDTVSFAYQKRLRTNLAISQPNASDWVQTYGYDAAKRLTNVTSQAGAFGYSYDALRPTLINRQMLPNGSYITNCYDSEARLLSTVLKNSANTLLNSHSYQLDQGSQRTQQVFTAGNYLNYSYDNIGQLKVASGKESGGTTNRLHEQFGYTYDAAGNLNFRTNNALVQNFGVNNLNELTAVTRSGTLTVAGTTTSTATNITVNSLLATLYGDFTFARSNFTIINGNNTFTAVAQDSYGRSDSSSVTVSLPATNSYSYDLNGNLLTDGTRGFDYDDENQLIRITVTNGWKSEFIYDGKYRRRIRKEYTWAGSAWSQTNEVRYVYDGNTVLQERNTNNLPIVTYTRTGTQLLARTDNSLAMSTPASAHSYYHADGNGNITALINTNQYLVAKYLYDPFGSIVSIYGPLAEANTYRFSSQEVHANSGLVLYLRRAYDPNLQRWINRDPIEEAGGGNLYGFVGNNPVNLFDSLGLDPSTWELFWLNIYDNGGNDVSRIGSRLGQNAMGIAHTANRALTDPFGLVYDGLGAIENAAGYLGKLSTEECERQRALERLKIYLSSPEAYVDMTLFAEGIMAGRLMVTDAAVMDVGATATEGTADGARFIVSGSGQVLDTSTITIPGPVNSAFGKVDYLLGNVTTGENAALSAGKGGFFRGVMGFDESSLGAGLQNHLINNFENAVVAGARINAVGSMTGPLGFTANVLTAWRITPEGTVGFVTAFPK